MQSIRKWMLLAVAALALTGQPGRTQESPKEFKSEAGRFSVLFPQPPQQQKQTGQTPTGTTDVYLFLLPTEQALYVVGYGDYPEASVKELGPDLILDGDRDSFVKATMGKLKSEKKITLDGHPGREFVVEVKQQAFLMREYLVKNRIYQVLTRSASAELPEVKRFQDSFKLLK